LTLNKGSVILPSYKERRWSNKPHLAGSSGLERRKKMGVYRRKDKEGKYCGPYIVQYPHRRDPITGKAIRTSLKVNGSKKLATRVYQQKLIEWEKKST
jgi:hypothetical protein